MLISLINVTIFAPLFVTLVGHAMAKNLIMMSCRRTSGPPPNYLLPPSLDIMTIFGSNLAIISTRSACAAMTASMSL